MHYHKKDASVHFFNLCISIDITSEVRNLFADEKLVKHRFRSLTRFQSINSEFRTTTHENVFVNGLYMLYFDKFSSYHYIWYCSRYSSYSDICIICKAKYILSCSLKANRNSCSLFQCVCFIQKGTMSILQRRLIQRKIHTQICNLARYFLMITKHLKLLLSRSSHHTLLNYPFIEYSIYIYIIILSRTYCLRTKFFIVNKNSEIL